MHFSKLVALLPLVASAPLDAAKRQTQAPSQNDILVLQLAHYLENLEYALYSGGCNQYTSADFVAAGLTSDYHDKVCIIASHEAIHRDFLAAALTQAGQTPLPACTYKFPYNNAGEFAALGNQITTVGIGAYIGGGSLLMDNPNLLQEASSILSVEARHDAFLRYGAGGMPFPSPYDTSLPALWAFNLAHQFVQSCPKDLPQLAPNTFVQLPMLQLTSPVDSSAPPDPKGLQKPLAPGTTLAFAWDPSKFFVSVDPNAPLYIAFVNQVSPVVYEQVTKTGAGSGTVTLPNGLNNSAFAALTTFSGGLNVMDLAAHGTLAGPQEIVVD